MKAIKIINRTLHSLNWLVKNYTYLGSSQPKMNRSILMKYKNCCYSHLWGLFTLFQCLCWELCIFLLFGRGLSSQSFGFSSSHVWMWELDYKESWAPKNGCFWTVVLEKTLESPLDCKEIQLVHPKGDQSWCSLEGLMLRLKLQYFGHLMRRTDSFEKTLMLGKIEDGRRRGC